MASSLNFSLLEKVAKLCKKKKQDQDNLSVTWLLFSKGSSFLIAIGFFMIFSENFLDRNAMQCYTNKENLSPYVVSFCFMHGTYYVEKEVQGKVTPCVIRNENFNRKPVTRYYLWLPYLLVFLFVLAKLPYWIWKRVYSTRVLLIFNSDDSSQLVSRFLYFSYQFKKMCLMYSLLEALNIIFLVFSFILTHFTLNKEFLFYGLRVIQYFFNEQNIANPGCHIFPTEVSCRLTTASSTGNINQNNFLCILTNNLFNQIFFFVLWTYWVFILSLAIVGTFFRIVRFNIKWVSKKVCLGKIENPMQQKKMMEIDLTASEWFFLEYLLYIKDDKNCENILCELCSQLELFSTDRSKYLNFIAKNI